jgi:membrane protease YdiL (CAAX protease family)
MTHSHQTSRPYAWEGVLVVFCFLLLLIGLNLALGLLQAAIGPIPLSPVLIIGELILLVVVGIWSVWRRFPWRETFLLQPTIWRMIGLSILVALLWWPVITALATLLEQLFSLIGPPPEIPPPQGVADSIGYFIAIVILAPLCEEPVFRGFIMRGWSRYGVVAAVVGSGILFGLQHAQLNALIPLSLAGLIIGFVALRAGSLWPAVAYHAVHNGLSAPFLLFPERLPEISDMTLIVAGGVSLPLAMVGLWFFHRYAPPQQMVEPETITSQHLIAIIVSSLLVAGVLFVILALEVFIRLNPEMAG